MTEAGITHYPRWQCTWSAEEIARLRHGSSLGQTAEEIAPVLGRTAKSIREKCSSLGLIARPRPEAHWPKDRLAKAKRFYDEGYSAQESAVELGVSRNAVIGKWHRHPDLFPPRLHIVNGHSAVKKIRTRGPRKPRPMLQRKAAPDTQFISEEITDLPPDESLCAVTFAQLDEAHQCHWPIGNPPNLKYCGKDKLDSCSYCARHARIAFRPTRFESQGLFMLKDRRA